MNTQLNIVETAEKHGKFTTFIKALGAAELLETLKGEGPFTVFIPSDAAFAKLSEITMSNFFRPENIGNLKSLLTFHVIPGKLMLNEMGKRQDTKTLQGQEVKIDASNGIRINNVTVQTTGIEASNGVIHIINNVLMPSKSAFAR